MMGRFLTPEGSAHIPSNINQALTLIGATTNVSELVQVVAEAYCLTVTLERDIAEIEAHYRALEQSDRHLHDQIMLALEGQFTERAAQVEFVERIANRLIDQGQFDTAHSIVSQLMTVLRQSPLAEAMAARQRRP